MNAFAALLSSFAALSTGIEVFGIDLLFIGLPIICLLGIVFYVLYRRRQARKEA
jgi:LPXTG-motif cell wall-anchored protein